MGRRDGMGGEGCRRGGSEWEGREVREGRGGEGEGWRKGGSEWEEREGREGGWRGESGDEVNLWRGKG